MIALRADDRGVAALARQRAAPLEPVSPVDESLPKACEWGGRELCAAGQTPPSRAWRGRAVGHQERLDLERLIGGLAGALGGSL